MAIGFILCSQVFSEFYWYLGNVSFSFWYISFRLCSSFLALIKLLSICSTFSNNRNFVSLILFSFLSLNLWTVLFLYTCMCVWVSFMCAFTYSCVWVRMYMKLHGHTGADACGHVYRCIYTWFRLMWKPKGRGTDISLILFLLDSPFYDR